MYRLATRHSGIDETADDSLGSPDEGLQVALEEGSFSICGLRSGVMVTPIVEALLWKYPLMF